MKESILKKIMDIAIILIFIGIIAIPLVCFNKNPNKILTTENRGTTQAPKMFLEDGKTLNIHFISQFDKYVNDNLGFKEKAVVFRLIQMYQLFHKVDIPNYMMGKEEHLFYTNDGLMIQTFQQKDLFTEEQKERFYNALKDTNNFFESTGAKFYFMTIPDKEQIYPEYYPESIQRYQDITKLEQFADYVKSKNDIDIFHVKDALLQSKGEDLLYYKNYDSTHWNMNGAFVGYQEIMKNLKKDFPQLKVFSKEDFNIVSEKSKGTLGHLSSIDSLCKLYHFDDTLYSYEFKEEKKAVDTMGTVPEGVELNSDVIYYHYINEANSNAPKLLIVGDSYIYSFMLPLLAESFSEVYFIGFVEESEKIADFQKKVKADIVLYENVERAFNYEGNVGKLEKFKKMYVSFDDFPYVNLEKISIKPALFVDIPSQQIEGQLNIADSSDIVSISGWALDNSSQAVWGELYAKIGDYYYKAERFERPDIEQAYSDYLMSGFTVNVPKEKLLESNKIEFIVISNDKTYQYQPVEFSISTN